MSRPPKLPKPEEIWRKLEPAEHKHLPSIVRKYEEIFQAVHDRPDVDRNDETPAHERQERVQTSETSDPTASIALAQGHRRRRLASLGKKAMRLADELKKLDASLDEVLLTEEDDYQPLANYVATDSRIKTSGEKMQQKRAEITELNRLESRAEALRSKLFGRSA